ncbi:MAG: YihY family inner membrane protein [Pseudomonadota bacterium]
MWTPLGLTGISDQILSALRLAGRFGAFLLNRFLEDRSLEVASELSYTTLLSLVPLMAVAVSVAGAFPVFVDVQRLTQDFIFANFVPAFGTVVQKYLQEFAYNASHLTAMGILSLVVTSLVMMSTIDTSFNRIWRVRVKRRALANFTVYWAVLTLGPMLIGASLLLTSQIFSAQGFTSATESVGAHGILLKITPFFATTLALFLIYMVVPNRTVALFHALAGALVAALLFEAAKRGFTLYITTVPTYETIFGTMAVVPVFLIWLYTSWLVALLGAEIAHALSAFPAWLRTGRFEGAELLWAFRVVGHLWEAQRKGHSIATRALLAWEPGLSEDMLFDLIGAFSAARLIQRTAEDTWILARDLSEITLLDLYRLLPHSVREIDIYDGDAWNETLARVVMTVYGEVRRVMDRSLKDLYLERPIGSARNFDGAENAVSAGSGQ